MVERPRNLAIGEKYSREGRHSHEYDSLGGLRQHLGEIFDGVRRGRADVSLDILLHRHPADGNPELFILGQTGNVRDDGGERGHFRREIGHVWEDEDEHRGQDHHGACVPGLL